MTHERRKRMGGRRKRNEDGRQWIEYRIEAKERRTRTEYRSRQVENLQ
jgi:hypothetical protein